MNDIWKSCNVSIGVKLKLLDACVFSSLLNACETWTMKKRDIIRLSSFEMKCYRKLLRITWSQHVTNESMRRALGRQRDIVQKIEERKLSPFEHICRMRDSRLIKIVMLGTVDGKRRRGRPRRRWLDDVGDWSNVDIIEAVRIAQNRQVEKEIIVIIMSLARRSLEDYGK
jgi:hypothetical protein